MAVQLTKRRRDDYLILEKEHDIGGTWRDNIYPGCGSDVPTALYSYSFEQNSYWSKLRSLQPEIRAYLRQIADKYDLWSKVLFGAEVVEYNWDEVDSCWHLITADGRTVTAQFIIVAIGPAPRIPNISGVDSFAGRSFHSAQWDGNIDLTGKKVAVIGTGASAIQFVPIIAEEAGRLHLYQRSAPWVVGRKNWRIPKVIQNLFAKVPLARSLFRVVVYLSAELQGFLTFGLGGRFHRVMESLCKVNIVKSIKDPALRDVLIPNYQIGCKRLLYSSTYYPALARSNTEVVTEDIAEIRPRSIVTIDGREREVDVIIYATGFEVIGKNLSLNCRGAGGELMKDRWTAESLQAYKGVAHTGLPNLFVLVGPNSAAIYTSLVFMIEQQIKYVLRAVDEVQRRGATSIEVRKGPQDRFNAGIQRKLVKRVWSTGGCSNFYLDTEGINRVVWSGFTWQYWWAMRNFDVEDFKFSGADLPEDSALRHQSRWVWFRESSSSRRPFSTAFAKLASRLYS